MIGYQVQWFVIESVGKDELLFKKKKIYIIRHIYQESNKGVCLGLSNRKKHFLMQMCSVGQPQQHTAEAGKGNSHPEAKAKTDKESIFDFSAPWRSLLPQHGFRLTRIATNLNRASMGIKGSHVALGKLYTGEMLPLFAFQIEAFVKGKEKLWGSPRHLIMLCFFTCSRFAAF